MKNEMTIIDQGALQEWPRLERGSGQPVLTDARTDIEAARLWITVKGARSAHTFDAYRREAWRLLLWLDEEGLCLNNLTVEDVHRFYALLVNPPPSWIRPVKVSRKQRLGKTQVLRGPLSGQSLNHTRNVPPGYRLPAAQPLPVLSHPERSQAPGAKTVPGPGCLGLAMGLAVRI